MEQLKINNCLECVFCEYSRSFNVNLKSGYYCRYKNKQKLINSTVTDLSKLTTPDWCGLPNYKST